MFSLGRFHPVLLCFAALLGLVLGGCASKEDSQASRKDGVYGQSIALAPRDAAAFESEGLLLDEFVEPQEEFNTESYDSIVENAFLPAIDNPLSTFAIDVDTASYANTRRFLNNGRLPPEGAVRIEEFINYFGYEDGPPTDEHPFAVHTELADCPWQPGHLVARIALKGREIEVENRPACNLVFLLDVSGSMEMPDKLPLVKSAMKLLTRQLTPDDRVSIVVYAGASGLALPPTAGDNQQAILDAMDRLQAGGSTNGGDGIRLAYQTAAENFVDGGMNRVLLCTDGDFNVGTTNQSELVSLIEEKAKSGVFLSVLGFGSGNLKDSTMEKLADKGNGNYAYIDTKREAEKVLVQQASGTLITIAKDVKIQVDFNPAKVSSYRLLGYENRLLRAEDFRDDTKDAGEIGAGHSVTALYEIVPVGIEDAGEVAMTEPSKYVEQPGLSNEAAGDELLTVRLRYKQPDEDESTEFRVPMSDESQPFEKASQDFQFCTSVAAFGMLLRNSEHAGSATFGQIAEIAASTVGRDSYGHRTEFVGLVEQAQSLSDVSGGVDVGLLE